MLKATVVRFGLLLVLACALAGLSACESVESTDNSKYLADGKRPDTLPWNKPEKWEGTGALGAIAGQDGRFGGR